MMFKTIIFVFFILYNEANSSEISQKDPCNDYDVITDNERAANLKLDMNTTNPFTDDRVVPGWYRIQNTVGEHMPTKPPGPFMCTTWHPIWLNGTLPKYAGKVSTQNVCLQNFYQTCAKSWRTQIKRCLGDYLVYELSRSPIMNSGYCFGWAKNCKDGKSNDGCYKTDTTTRSFAKTTAEPRTESTKPSNENGNHGRPRPNKEWEETVKIQVTLLTGLAILVICLICMLKFLYARYRRKTTSKKSQSYIIKLPRTMNAPSKAGSNVNSLRSGKGNCVEELPPPYSGIHPLCILPEKEIPL